MLADYHMHTSFSDDSNYPMEEEIKYAIALGVDEICFCEHVDHGVKTDLNCDYIKYRDEFNRCVKEYKDQITMRFGIEFGMQVHTIDQFQSDFDTYPFDFVILSCHQVDDREFWNQQFQEGKTQEEYNRKYYEEILHVIERYDDYSVLGHLDAIKRDDKAGIYPFENVKKIITDILQRVIQQGKGIEVNTSNFRYGLADLTPSRDILKLYYELGGTILTIGSDTHQEEHVAYQIPYVKEELKKIGFTTFCTYEKMLPSYHAL